ncbi:MAG: SEL1-like repeat protein [Candidatus Sulfotelmatobacter sp.]
MSNTLSDEPITCASCEYRYPPSEATCVMCGTAAPAVKALRPLSSVPDEFSGADHEAGPSSSDSQRPLYPGLRRLIPVVVILIALMVVTSFFHKVRKGNLPNESGSASELTATSGQPKLENAGQRHIVQKPASGVQHVVAAKLGTVQTIDAAKGNDPVELWKAVRRGSVSAEVTLANLYLEGESVPQSCEQAHMLLSAASMKGSKAADTLLKSGYAERCE